MNKCAEVLKSFYEKEKHLIMTNPVAYYVFYELWCHFNIQEKDE